MKELKKLIKCKDMSLEMKIKIVHTLVCPVTLYGYESWTVKKVDRKKIDLCEIWCWRRCLQMKLALLCFGHIMRRQNSLEKTMMPGRVEESRKRGKSNVNWIDVHQGSHGLESTRTEQGC